MAKLKEMTAKRRKKKCCLLLEPTVEEEQFAESMNAKSSNQSSSSMNETGDTRDENYRPLFHGRKNQSESSSIATTTTTTNVISVYNNSEENASTLDSSNRCSMNERGRNSVNIFGAGQPDLVEFGCAKRRQNRAQLTTLLSLLFSLIMMLSVAIVPNLAQSQRQQQQSTPTMLFNLTLTTSVPRSVKNFTVTVPPLPANSLRNETLALLKISEKNTSTAPSFEPSSANGSGFSATTLPVMASKAAIVAATTTTSTIANADSNNNGDGDAENGSENSLALAEDEENSDSDSDAGKSTNKLLVNTASEAADQFIKRLRADASIVADSDETVDSENSSTENDSMTTTTITPAAGEENERRIDRRDYGDSDTNAKLTRSAIETEQPSANGRSGRLDNQTTKSAAEELRFALETYTKWREASDGILEIISRKVLPVVIEHSYDIDAVTVTGLIQLFNGIRALKPWALKVLDASAKLTPGLLVGTQSDFGDFDECLNVRVDDPSGLQQVDLIPLDKQELDPETGLPSSTVIGRYCLADIEFPKPPRVRLTNRNEELQADFAPIELRNPLFNFSQTEEFKDTIWVETANFFHMLYVDPIRVGICLTNKIDPDSFAQVLNKLTKHLEVSINFHGRCVTKYDKLVWTRYQKVSAYVLVIACTLVALCTFMDLFYSKLNKLPLPVGLNKWKSELRIKLTHYRPLFTSFSLIRNTKRLFKPQSGVKLTPDGSSMANIRSSNQYNLNLQLSMARCSTSASGIANCYQSSSSSSSESSPSIQRRSSVDGSSGLNLISDSSSLATDSTATAENKLLPDCQLISKRSAVNNLSAAAINVGELTTTTTTTATAQQHRSEINLQCLHGIRVITMVWMIVNHTYLFGGFFVLWAHRRLIDIAEWPKSISFQLVLNGWLTVETYFFLSATIIVLNVMPMMKKQRFAYLPYILHRLLRLLPAYTGLVCLNFLWPLISSGPVWLVKGKSFIQTPCENYLWTNFLFINNWIWPEKQCMVHTWFLSADFQLYLLAPIIVYLLYSRPVLGHSLNIIVALLASLLSGFVIYANKLMPSTLINKLEFDSIKQQLSYSYFATYQHMGPYCLGIFTGYLLHKRNQINLPRHLTWLLWLLLPPLSFTTLLLTYLWNGAYNDPAMINPSPLVSALYVAIHRTIWTSLLAWIVFACATGRAKLMSSFLSHSIFIPISRLSFSIYLVHLPVIMFRALNLRHTLEWTDSNILWEACGNFIVSLIFGYFLNIAFESPIINLERVIFGRSQELTSTTTTTTTSQQNNGALICKQVVAGAHIESSPVATANIDTTIDTTSDEDNKSAQSGASQHLSQIAGLKMSDSSVTPNPSSSEEASPRQFHWSEYSKQGGLVGSLTRRKLLKPKQNSSVEVFFGNQMEPLSLTGKTALVNAKTKSSSHLDDLNQTPHRTTYQQMAPAAKEEIRNSSEPQQVRSSSRYLNYNPPSNQLDASLSTQNNDSLTSSLSIVNDQQVYDYHRFRANHLRHLQKFNHSQRTTQYATLARSSRFDHQFGPPNSPRLDQFDRLDHQQRLAQLFNAPSNNKSQNLNSNLISQPLPIEQDGAAKSSTRFLRQRAHLFQRRQGRYNTLTGSGAQEWRRQYMDAADQNWHMIGLQTPKHLQRWDELSEHDTGVSATNYLQPGTMIPRIDSSTLRRHSIAKNEPAGSIEEEPSFESKEDADL